MLTGHEAKTAVVAYTVGLIVGLLCGALGVLVFQGMAQ